MLLLFDSLISWLRSSGLLDDGIEDPYLLPILPVFVDELTMQGRLLITVVIVLRAEDDMQRHVEIAVVDGTIQVRGQRSAGKEDNALMRRQVFLARLAEPLLGRLRRIFQGKIHVVCYHGSCASCLGLMEKIRLVP